MSVGNFQGIPGTPLRQTGEFKGDFWELVGTDRWRVRSSKCGQTEGQGLFCLPTQMQHGTVPVTEWMSHRASSKDTTLRPPGLGSVPEPTSVTELLSSLAHCIHTQKLTQSSSPEHTSPFLLSQQRQAVSRQSPLGGEEEGGRSWWLCFCIQSSKGQLWS